MSKARERLLRRMHHDAHCPMSEDSGMQCRCWTGADLDALLSDDCHDDLAEAAGLYTRDQVGEAQASEHRIGQQYAAEKIAEAIEADGVSDEDPYGWRIQHADIARSYAKEEHPCICDVTLQCQAHPL